jgi:diguanylate cyclase (GGDEF)-like protein
MTNDSVPSAHDADAAYASSMSVLLEVTRAVRSGTDITDLLGTIARAASEALGFGTVVLNLYRPEWDDLCVAAVHGDRAVRDALAGAVYGWDEWLPLLSPRFRREGAYFIPFEAAYDWSQHGARFVPQGEQEVDGGWHPEDELFVPLERSDGAIIGILSFGHPVDGLRPSDRKLAVAMALASHAALALETAQEHEQLARHQRGLEELLRVSSQLPQTVSTEAMLASVCAAIRDALDFDKVLVQLVDPVDGFLAPAAAAGWDEDEPALTVRLDTSLIARLFVPEFEIAGCYLVPRDEAVRRVGRTQVVYESVQNGTGPQGWNHHWLAVPLRRADASLAGVIWADEPRNRQVPSANVLQALRIFGNHASEALAAATQLAETRFLAEHDPLTGLLNRRALVDRLAEATAQERMHELALVFLDLDNFKQINDEYGHTIGDRVLEQVGASIGALMRDGALAFRVGGDEFAVLLSHGGERDADELVGELIASFMRHADPLVRKLSASFGVAAGRRTEEPDELLRIADEAMYASKRAARRMEIAV